MPPALVYLGGDLRKNDIAVVSPASKLRKDKNTPILHAACLDKTRAHVGLFMTGLGWERSPARILFISLVPPIDIMYLLSFYYY